LGYSIALRCAIIAPNPRTMLRRKPPGQSYTSAFILRFELITQFDEMAIARSGNFENSGVLLNNEKSRSAGFARNDRKAAALLAGPGSFDGRIQCEDIGLERDALDHRDDLRNLFRAAGDPAHCLEHAMDDFPTSKGRLGRVGGERVALQRILGILLHGRGEFFHARSSFFQRCSLLFRTLAKIGIACRNLRGPRSNTAIAHAPHHAASLDPILKLLRNVMPMLSEEFNDERIYGELAEF
jgi:hypothetical protein